jgi:hypothetical protein
MVPSYRVLIDDNFHYMDEDERYEHGQFDSLEAAIAACKHIVDAFLEESYTPGMTAASLYDSYTAFGQDPFIVGGEGGVLFSAWDYAKARCTEIVQRRPSERD